MHSRGKEGSVVSLRLPDRLGAEIGRYFPGGMQAPCNLGERRDNYTHRNNVLKSGGEDSSRRWATLDIRLFTIQP